MQRWFYCALFVMVPLSAAGLRAAEEHASGGTSEVVPVPPILPEAEVIGRPEGAVSPRAENGAAKGTVPFLPPQKSGQLTESGAEMPPAEYLESPQYELGPGGPGTVSVFNGTMFQSPSVTGYGARSSTVATLIDVPQVDLPATVAVAPEALIIDKQILRMDDLLPDVPGAVKVNDDQRPDAFYLRGFQVMSRDYRKDGFLDPTYTPRDFTNVDRVEILEGPSSSLYGPGQPSGVVNLITKQPLADGRQEASVQFGSWGLQRYTVDSNCPIYEDRSLLFRVTAAYQKNDSFRDFGYNESNFVAPALTWVIDRDTTLTWHGEFDTDRRRYDTGVAAVNGQLVLPVSRFLGEPTDFQHFQDYRESLVLNCRINDDWSWEIGGYSLFYNSESSATIPDAELTGLPGSFARQRQDIGPFLEQYQSLMTTLAGQFDFAGMTHHVVFGNEDGWFTSDAFHAALSTPYIDLLPIDAFAPAYGTVTSPYPAEQFYSNFYQADYGIYFQDLVDVADHWKVLAGVRYDHTEVIFNRTLTFLGVPFINAARSVEGYDVGSPRVGVIYEPVPEKVSFYGMYSASFDPPGGGPYLEAAPLQPEFGQIWEGGVKINAGKGLMLAAAGYHIVKENVSVMAPSNALMIEQVDSQRSDGAEFSAVGKLTERLSVLANYAYTNTEMTDPTPGSFINGQRALNVPYNTASLWMRYNFLAAERRTLGVGLGFVYVGERLAAYDSGLELPSYTRCDAGLYYHHNSVDANLYVENLFNTYYYTSAINQFEVFPGAPINVKGQVTLRF